MKAIEIGQVLHNGATVIEFNNDVILARWTNDITPYVTWRYMDNDPSTTVWGHYFENFEDAVKDFNDRSKDRAQYRKSMQEILSLSI